MNVLPDPTSLRAVTPPPCILASSATNASPIPDPSCVLERAPTTRWNRSNRCTWSAGSMPIPVSLTSSWMLAAWSRVVRASRMAIPPVKVNLRALESRFETILAHISRST